jgi:hypothetical protein
VREVLDSSVVVLPVNGQVSVHLKGALQLKHQVGGVRKLPEKVAPILEPNGVKSAQVAHAITVLVNNAHVKRALGSDRQVGAAGRGGNRVFRR